MDQIPQPHLVSLKICKLRFATWLDGLDRCAPERLPRLQPCCLDRLADAHHCYSHLGKHPDHSMVLCPSLLCRYLILAMVKLIGLSRLGKLQRAAAVMTFFFSVVVCFDRYSTVVMPAVWLVQAHLHNSFS
jgi:hypothetical protein